MGTMQEDLNVSSQIRSQQGTSIYPKVPQEPGYGTQVAATAAAQAAVLPATHAGEAAAVAATNKDNSPNASDSILSPYSLGSATFIQPPPPPESSGSIVVTSQPKVQSHPITVVKTQSEVGSGGGNTSQTTGKEGRRGVGPDAGRDNNCNLSCSVCLKLR